LILLILFATQLPLLFTHIQNVYSLLVGKPEEKSQPGRPRRRRVDNIKMDLVQTGWGGVDWIGLVLDRDKWRALVNAVMNLRVL
jgi:hypothetical protein